MDDAQVSTEMVEWLMERIGHYGNATMSEFAEKFKYSNREDADRTFSTLISRSTLRKRTRHTLQSNYEVWKRNEGDQFWASLVARTKVATDIVIGSVPKARKIVLGDDHLTSAKLNTPTASSSIPNECPASTSEHPTKGLVASSSTSSSLDVISTDDDGETSSAGEGRRTPPMLRSPSYDAEGLATTPVRINTSSMRARTEDTNIPTVVQADFMPNPFVVSSEESDILPAIRTDLFEFKGRIGKIELGPLFTAYHAATVQKRVPITHVHDVLSRSGILLLNGTVPSVLRQHIPESILDDVSQIFNDMHWRTVDISKDRERIRQWQDIFEDEKDPEIIVEKLLQVSHGSRSNLRLWLFFMNTTMRLTQNIQPRNYSEVTGMASYILPLMEVFLHDPQNKVILTCPNTTTKAGAHRKELLEAKHGKRPDMLVSVVNPKLIFHGTKGDLMEWIGE
ncbi:hypothetical protein BGZ65_007951 [Modicella reniformis]|uniref:Uncharacterized protein n=1 Tax=Modicella reniformis TaxID=1440133 RepID=A0A9P6IN17_9FUNG|nr:hypothetical protein BGZ65_007951 [Modicella reniformis]